MRYVVCIVLVGGCSASALPIGGLPALTTCSTSLQAPLTTTVNESARNCFPPSDGQFSAGIEHAEDGGPFVVRVTLNPGIEAIGTHEFPRDGQLTYGERGWTADGHQCAAEWLGTVAIATTADAWSVTFDAKCSGTSWYADTIKGYLLITAAAY